MVLKNWLYQVKACNLNFILGYGGWSMLHLIEVGLGALETEASRDPKMLKLDSRQFFHFKKL